MSVFYNIIVRDNNIVLEDFFTLYPSGDPLEGLPQAIANPSVLSGQTVTVDSVTSVDVSVVSCTNTTPQTLTINTSDWLIGTYSADRMDTGVYFGLLNDDDIFLDSLSTSGMNIYTVTLTINYLSNGSPTTSTYVQQVFLDTNQTCRCKIYEHAFENKDYDKIAQYEALTYIADCPNLATAVCDPLKLLTKICNDDQSCNC